MTTLIIAAALMVLDSESSQAPKGQMHPEWGPEPPVAPVGHDQLPSERVVASMIFPVLGQARWKDDFNEDRGKFRHTGIDIKAPKMTPIVAPFKGVIGFKKESFWIYGDNGWTVLGTHLNDDNLGTHDHKGDRDLMFAPDLVAGAKVEAGQFIGYVGQSGDATAPHLHFELYAPGQTATMDRIRNPFPSLKAAQIISAPRPFLTSEKLAATEPVLRFWGCVRSIGTSKGVITLILTGREAPNGKAVVVTKPTYQKFTIPAAVVEAIGGWTALNTVRSSQVLEVVTDMSGTQVKNLTIGP